MKKLFSIGYEGAALEDFVDVLKPATGDCHLVTIYWPDLMIWDETFKIRKA